MYLLIVFEETFPAVETKYERVHTVQSLGKDIMKKTKDKTHNPNYIKRIKKEINYIRPFENDDLEWYEEGLRLLETDKLREAELKFKELIISQPESLDGYEGLSLVYEKLGRKDEALFFINEAYNKVRKFLKEDTLETHYGKILKRIQQMD